MKRRKQNLTTLLVFVFAAVLALPAVYSFRTKIVEAGVQDPARSDVKTSPKPRSATPQIPQGAAPSNDNCANAIAVNACPFTDTKDTSGASDEASEPQSTCTLQANSVWYTLPPSANFRNVTVDTCAGSDFDTAIMVWEVNAAQPCNFAGFVAIACNDDTCGDGFQSSVSFTAQPNTTYKLQIGGFDGETGTLSVNVACTELLCNPIVINGTLGSGDPSFPGPQTSGNMVGRLNRNGISSTCAAPKTCLIFDPANNRAFDAYSIPNESGEDACVSVTLTAPANATCNMQSNAYLGAVNPASICTNYLADPGLSLGVPPTPTNMSFVVPAGQTLTVVVMTTNPGETGCAYTVTILGDLCQQFDYCVQDNNVPGRFIKINSTTGAYEYHDCSKGVVLTGTGAVSTYFCKIQLFDSGPDPKRSDRSISVLVNPCTMRGDASVKTPGAKTAVTIGDSNVLNNTCACP